MFTTPFWPAASSYHIHVMNIALPNSLSHAALDFIPQAKRLAEVIGFLLHSSPHYQREEADLLLSRFGRTVDMIEYERQIKGFIL